MLLALCKHYDVTPTYLLDDERPIEPQTRDRWTERGALISRGDWLECPDGAAIKTADGMWLAPVMAGARFYDSTAQAQRMLCHHKQEAISLERSLVQAESARDRELEQMLSNELLGQRKPRTKPVRKLAKAPVALPPRRQGEEIVADA
jgi:hypothetical protein